MDQIDLRSDTVTWLTDDMRQAMAEAAIGDDVYGEDPSVNRLEAMAAERFGKEAGLFVASGTMGNLVAILVHCGRGDEAIMGQSSHTFVNETGNPAALGGIHSWTLPVQPDGTLALDAIEDTIRGDDPHYPQTTLVCLENTQGSTGGQPLPVSYIDAVGELCQRRGLRLHIDGARIFNAAVALNEDVARLTQASDSISFCLSKGLCVPMGSVIVGSRDFIYHARRIRKSLGGGLRQAGFMAAAGIVALETMVDRLTEDHTNAYRLAEGLAELPAFDVDLSRIKTNILFVTLRPNARLSAAKLREALAKDNIRIGGANRHGRMRFVTHYWITEERVDFVLERMRQYLA